MSCGRSSGARSPIHAATNPAAKQKPVAPEGEPGQLHPKGKIEGGFGLDGSAATRLVSARFSNGGDNDPGD